MPSSRLASIRSSSLRVPEELILIAGQMRISAHLRSSTISMLPVPLNSWKITSSMRLPVSTRIEAMIVSEPASSVLRAAANNWRGFSSARTSRPPEPVRPELRWVLCARRGG